MKKLETLSISFENLDHVVIPAKYIIDMTICGIQKSSGITYKEDVYPNENKYNESSSIYTDDFKLDVDYTELLPHIDEYDAERLVAYSDADSITLTFDDQTQKHIGLPWSGIDQDTSNACQTQFLSWHDSLKSTDRYKQSAKLREIIDDSESRDKHLFHQIFKMRVNYNNVKFFEENQKYAKQSTDDCKQKAAAFAKQHKE